jgi:hypothetical protein
LQNGKIDLLHQCMVFSPGPKEHWDKSSWLDYDKHDLGEQYRYAITLSCNLLRSNFFLNFVI